MIDEDSSFIVKCTLFMIVLLYAMINDLVGNLEADKEKQKKYLSLSINS